MKNKPKIAFLICDVDAAGAFASISLIIKNIDRSKFHVVVLTCGSGPLATQIARFGDEYHNLRTGSYPKLRKWKNGKVRIDSSACFRLISWLIQSVWRLSKWLRSEKIVLIHTNGVQFNLVAGIAGRLARVPSIWHIHSPWRMVWKRGGPFLVEGYLASYLATKFIANSHFTDSGFHHSWRKKAIMIHNAIDVKAIIDHQHPGRLREIANVSENEKLVGILGLVEHRKGMERFIEMAAKLMQKHDNVKFVIVGGCVGIKEISEAFKADLVRLAEKLGISKKLCFTGHIDDASYYVGDLDAFFMCSRPGTETFGLVVIEAMAASVPVVAFNNDAMGEIIIDGKTGFLVPEGDIDLAAERILRILDDKSLADNIKEAALDHVRNNFDTPILVDNIQKLYCETLQKTRLGRDKTF